MASRSERPADAYEAVVIGGGPAGSTVARLLAAWGRSVLVLTRTDGRGPLAVSLPPSCVELLQRLELFEAVERAGFYRTTGNTAWWAGERTAAPFPEGRTGFQVVRDRLEAVLLAQAERTGAEVRRGATVESVRPERPAVGVSPGWGDGSASGPFRVRWTGPSGAGQASADWVFDCSGRVGILAREGLRVHEPGEATLALMATWISEEWGLSDPTHTLVESYANGWAWSIPVSERERYVTVMVDPRASDLIDERALDPLYAAELARTTHLRALVAAARRSADPWACSASSYTASRFGGPGWLLVGDAASFIDPLSSFGVKKALASGWLAAVVAYTALAEPGMGDHALELYESRERAMYRAYRAGSKAFARAAADDGGHAFWTGRASDGDPVDGIGQEEGGGPAVETLRASPDVLMAFESLRRAPEIRFDAGPGVRVEPRPTVRGRKVVLEDRLRTPALPEGVRTIRGVDLVALMAMAPHHAQVPDLFESYCRAHEPVILPDFLGVLSVMLAKGILTWRPNE